MMIQHMELDEENRVSELRGKVEVQGPVIKSIVAQEVEITGETLFGELYKTLLAANSSPTIMFIFLSRGDGGPFMQCDLKSDGLWQRGQRGWRMTW
jgi:hypothetical protein